MAPKRYYTSIKSTGRLFTVLCLGYAGYVAVSSWFDNSLWSRNRRRKQIAQVISNINSIKRYRDSRWYNSDNE